mmetsp:Transcript_61451/g.179634  ORF Transcript_61451/g.179634 Transcript_61451/m.179634 type:complete len:317 (-) Transcript_61451:24-974(-)
MTALLRLAAVTQLLQGIAASASSAAVHEPANAAHPHGPLDGEAVISHWPRISSLVNMAAMSLHGVVPADTPMPVAAPEQVEEALPQGDGWEARFARGVHRSKMITDVADVPVDHWVMDRKGSGAGVPAQMLEAEELLLAAEEAPAAAQRERTAERALRIYGHAKWLAEQNLQRAAEWRYREAHALARRSRRSVLAAHALSRLGYFLMHWGRPGEAREVLRESERLSRRSNPLAPYLYGVLERRAAGADAERLRLAEERILNSEEQPSEELEDERRRLLEEISYWRAAESSPRSCLEAWDSARVLACLLGHAAFAWR